MIIVHENPFVSLSIKSRPSNDGTYGDTNTKYGITIVK